MLNNYGTVITEASLINYNTYGIKTKCKYLIKPNSINNLINLLNYIKDNNIKYYILGKGSNVILPDNYFNGIIISLELLNKLEINDNIVTSECGILLSTLIKECINNSLGGLEYLALIPGTLGGALYGNAGCNNHCIYDNLISVEVIRNNKLIKLLKNDIEYSYRNTLFKNNKDILVRATFKLENEDKDKLKNIVSENRIKRLNTQPLEYKNAGSVFKNPENNYAAKLIEDLGLKGFNVNDAKVSLKHANFIINENNATSKDIKELIKIIQDKVYKEYKINLELEQIIVEWE